MIKRILAALGLFKVYEYGSCSNRPARRNRITGDVEFVLWNAGQHEHVTDFWHRFGDGHELTFKPAQEQEGK